MAVRGGGRVLLSFWLIAFAAPFVAYVVTICPSVYGLDSSEFTSAAWLLGISHPPGHPLHALLGKLASFVPLGDIALRLALLSALLGALSSLALFATLSRFIRPVPSLALALAFAASHAVWFQSIRAEVYTLHAALITAALAAITRFPSSEKSRLAAAFLIGLALANHHYLTVVAIPGLALIHAAVHGRVSLNAHKIVRSGAFVVLGLATYLYLPLRAGRVPEVDWGRPDTSSRFAWTVSAQLFQKSAERPRGSLAEGTTRALEVVASDLHLVAAVAGFIALALLIAARKARLLGVALAILFAGAIFPKAQMGFLTSNPDDHGYLIVALAPLLIAIAAGLEFARDKFLNRLRASLQRNVVVAAALLVGALPVLVTLENFERNDGCDRRGADTLARDQLRSIPEGTFLFSAYFKTEFAFAYLQGVERGRPDVTVVHRNALKLPGVLEDLATRPRAEVEMIGAVAKGLNARAEMTALAARRPFWWEIDFTMVGDDMKRLVPRGYFAEWMASPTSIDMRAAGLQERAFFLKRDAHLLAATGGDTEDIETIFWIHYLRGRFWATLGERIFSFAAFDRALAIDPNNGEVKAERAQVSGEPSQQ
ncbi:MAG: DUF2723 domain-containing protein [Deltaproteobacteria bacterium]|nr:DUF2723 domain-containing protein [Deltaproteobacteria bacterium]